jgi:hypothetical protein
MPAPQMNLLKGNTVSEEVNAEDVSSVAIFIRAPSAPAFETAVSIKIKI